MEILDNSNPQAILAWLRQAEADLPTAEKIHAEIGLSWEVIASVYACSKNDVNQFAHLVPQQFYLSPPEEAPDIVLSIWDKAINTYCMERMAQQPGRSEQVQTNWRKLRPKYERALKIVSCILPDYSVTQYVRERNPNYVPGYEIEYDPDDIAYDIIAEENRQKLLKKMRPLFDALTSKQQRSLTAYYEGYAALFSLEFVVCLSIFRVETKQSLKRKLDAMAVEHTASSQLRMMLNRASVLKSCKALLDTAEKDINIPVREREKSLWDRFVYWCEHSIYEDTLNMAIMLERFPLWEKKPWELELCMTYAFCLTLDQKKKVMEDTKALLTVENILPGCNVKDIAIFIEGRRRSQEILEQYFELPMATEVYEEEYY